MKSAVLPSCIDSIYIDISLIHLMRAIARAHANIRATSLMRIKITRATSVYDTQCLGRWNAKMKELITFC